MRAFLKLISASTFCPTLRVAEGSLRTTCAIRPLPGDRPSFPPPPSRRCTAPQSPAPWVFAASACPHYSVPEHLPSRQTLLQRLVVHSSPFAPRLRAKPPAATS